MTESTATTPTSRLFIAIELPTEALAWCSAAIDRARQELGASAASVRWVRPEGIHLTLKFLGEVPIVTEEAIADGLWREIPGLPELDLAIGPAGVFPNVRRPRAFWLGLLGDLAALSVVQERVEAVTVPLRFPRDPGPFQPHLTLGRVRESARAEDLAAVGRLPVTWPVAASPAFRVTTVSLIQSQLGPSGARYTTLTRIPFATPSTFSSKETHLA